MMRHYFSVIFLFIKVSDLWILFTQLNNLFQINIFITFMVFMSLICLCRNSTMKAFYFRIWEQTFTIQDFCSPFSATSLAQVSHPSITICAQVSRTTGFSDEMNELCASFRLEICIRYFLFVMFGKLFAVDKTRLISMMNSFLRLSTDV